MTKEQIKEMRELPIPYGNESGMLGTALSETLNEIELLQNDVKKYREALAEKLIAEGSSDE